MGFPHWLSLYFMYLASQNPRSTGQFVQIPPEPHQQCIGHQLHAHDYGEKKQDHIII